jgi:hypothetical protein
MSRWGPSPPKPKPKPQPPSIHVSTRKPAAPRCVPKTKSAAIGPDDDEFSLCPISLGNVDAMPDLRRFKVCNDSQIYDIKSLYDWVVMHNQTFWPHNRKPFLEEDYKRLISQYSDLVKAYPNEFKRDTAKEYVVDGKIRNVQPVQQSAIWINNEAAVSDEEEEEEEDEENEGVISWSITSAIDPLITRIDYEQDVNNAWGGYGRFMTHFTFPFDQALVSNATPPTQMQSFNGTRALGIIASDDYEKIANLVKYAIETTCRIVIDKHIFKHENQALYTDFKSMKGLAIAWHLPPVNNVQIEMDVNLYDVEDSPQLTATQLSINCNLETHVCNGRWSGDREDNHRSSNHLQIDATGGANPNTVSAMRFEFQRWTNALLEEFNIKDLFYIRRDGGGKKPKVAKKKRNSSKTKGSSCARPASRISSRRR